MRRLLAAVATCVGLSACYHVNVITGAPPAVAAKPAIDKQWQNSFVYGLVPPPPVDTHAACPTGVASVMTERSFLNGLVSALTWNLYTPLHVTVTCASGPVPRG